MTKTVEVLCTRCGHKMEMAVGKRFSMYRPWNGRIKQVLRTPEDGKVDVCPNCVEGYLTEMYPLTEVKSC